MTDTKRERIAKALLGVVREVWCDRDSDDEPYFNCSVCEFEDGENCVLKQFINAKNMKRNILKAWTKAVRKNENR